ncbi:MAG: CopG family transcriptional regulator [Anaerolineales bacterium]|nr:CopG family transcriptional regulator [Anaerolineales bacterium]MCB0011198.1 CopG family transcriptional regulator [Anaerolineales bacterium]
MRTTVNIDDDVLDAIRELARRKRLTMGQILSDLARQSLTRHIKADTRNGVPLFPAPPGGEPVALELVNVVQNDAG